jgi:DNA-binding NarL/FixJ family response regulator
MPKSKVLLIEDDNLLRMGLKSMIDMKGEYVVGSDVGTGREGIQSFNHNHADVVLLDLRLPDMPGTEVLKKLREKDKRVKIVVLTACDSDEMLFETLEYGTNAYVLKGENPDELFLAMKYALNDDLFISPRLAKTIVKDYLYATRQRKGFPTLQGLTPRELEVVKLIFDGNKSREIADMLGISIKTVDKHRSNILQKIGIHNFNELRQGGLYFLDFMNQTGVS